RNIDEKCPGLHSIDLGPANQLPRTRRVRPRQDDNVAPREELGETIERPDVLDAFGPGLPDAASNRGNPQPERPGDGYELVADGAKTNDPHSLALQRPDIDRRALELVLRPAVRDLRAHRGRQATRERDADAQHVLGN